MEELSDVEKNKARDFINRVNKAKEKGDTVELMNIMGELKKFRDAS